MMGERRVMQEALCGAGLLKFGQEFVRRLRRKRPSHRDIWHLDEVVVSIGGQTHWLWRAVDQEGYVLDEILQTRRGARAAARLLRRRSRSRAPRRSALSPTNWALTPRLGERSCRRSSIARIRGSTTGRRTPICPFDDESDHCRASDRRQACNGSSTYPPPSVNTSFRPAPAGPLCPSTCIACALWPSGSSSPVLPLEPALEKRPSSLHRPLK